MKVKVCSEFSRITSFNSTEQKGRSGSEMEAAKKFGIGGEIKVQVRSEL